MTDEQQRQRAGEIAQEAMARIRRRRGARARIALALGVCEQSPSTWKRVPLANVFAVAKVVRLPVEQLRPDFFLDDPLRHDLALEVVVLGLPIEPPREAAKRGGKPKLGDAALAIWKDPAYASNKLAAAAISKALAYPFSNDVLRARLGPSGRAHNGFQPGNVHGRPPKPRRRTGAAERAALTVA